VFLKAVEKSESLNFIMSDWISKLYGYFIKQSNTACVDTNTMYVCMIECIFLQHCPVWRERVQWRPSLISCRDHHVRLGQV